MSARPGQVAHRTPDPGTRRIRRDLRHHLVQPLSLTDGENEAQGSDITWLLIRDLLAPCQYFLSSAPLLFPSRGGLGGRHLPPIFAAIKPWSSFGTNSTAPQVRKNNRGTSHPKI